jgi:beta-fructofuranosidase
MTFSEILSTRQRLASDFHRPSYHFLPPSNWMNDPNGFIHWNGQYHLFYQYNPTDSVWGNMHWGHAVSDDLIHWRDLPIALAPTPGGADETGVFSGCAVVDDGVPTVIYTGARGERYDVQTQNLAISRDDGLVIWEKSPHNPVLSEVPAVAGQTENFRDPFVWRDGEWWYMVLASEIRGQGGAIFLYRSSDLIHWEYLHPLLTGDKARNGVIWECPNFFPIGDEWILILSAIIGAETGHVLYFVGSFENLHFTPHSEGVLDYSAMYAPLTTSDANGRRLLAGWIRETRSAGDMRRAGWSGAQSIPRVLALDERKRVLMRPVAEVEAIRGAHHRFSALAMGAEQSLGLNGLAWDMAAAVEMAPDGRFALSVACDDTTGERTRIVYDSAKHMLAVETVTPGIGSMRITQSRAVPHHLDAGEALSLRVLLDGSVLEVIANERTSLTHRLYPSAASGDIRVEGQGASIRALDLWEMQTIWHTPAY